MPYPKLRVERSRGIAEGTITVQSVTASTAMAVEDDVVLASGAITITLPDPVTAVGHVYWIQRIGAAGTVTVAPNGSETIDGAANLTLTSQYAAAGLVSDGTNWMALSLR